MREIWKPVVSWPGYEVSSEGRIRQNSGEPVPRRMTKYGYIHVWHDAWDVPRTESLHVLVLTAFAGERPTGTCACHVNDIPDDNRIVNLCWGTDKLNGLHRALNGSSKRLLLKTTPVAIFTKAGARRWKFVTTWETIPEAPGYRHIPLVKPIPYLPIGWFE
jgi:hypothetical protein